MSFWKVIGIKSLLSYEGTSVKEPKENFINVIDGYLADCKERPNLNSLIRVHLISGITPELHRNISVYVIEHGKSLNAVVEKLLKIYLNDIYKEKYSNNQ